MSVYVIKRDQRKVPFNSRKIVNAICAAFKSVDGEVNEYALEKANKIAEYVEEFAENQSRDLDIEEIQDLVEKGLSSTKRKDVAKAYILYRNERAKQRYKNLQLTKMIGEKLEGKNIENQNANVDELSFGGRKGEAADVLMKDYALNYCMSETAKNNHLNNEIYTHDLSAYAVGQHNCMSIPFDDLLSKGFTTRQADIRPANSINTAFQLLAVIFQLQSLQEFGGVSATHLDWTMVPYVRISFYKHYLDGLKYLSDEKFDKDIQPKETSIEDKSVYADEKAYQYAMDKTNKELKQAVEAMFHNLNTLQSRSGNQLPFTSINFGTCTSTEGRMVIKAILEGGLEGIGKFHKTSIFPCTIFQCMKGVNRKEGDANYDLFRLALKSTAKRLYPNYANVDWSGNAGYDVNDPRTYFSTMGLILNLAHIKSFELCQQVSL